MPLEESMIQIERPEFPRLSDYFGMWAMDESAFSGLQNLILASDLSEHVAVSRLEKLRDRRIEETAEARDSSPYQVTNGVAVIEIRGTMMKSESSFGESTSTIAARQSIRMASRDPKVSGILLLIDSPGGTVAGTNDLAMEIENASKTKPTAAYIEDVGASAAYWAASQTGRISTGPTSLVGSIGTLFTVRDSSVAHEKAGLKVHVIKAGAFKGAGVPGAEVTESHLAEFQRRIDDTNSEFVNAALVKGRGMSAETAAAVADGRAHVGKVAMQMGLVDAIESLEEAVASLMERAGNGQRGSVKGQIEMTENVPAAPKAATLAELKTAFPKADPAFVLGQLEATATIADAKGAWADLLEARLEAKEAELVDAKASGGKKSGVEPFTESGKGADAATTFEDPKAEFEKLRSDYAAKNNCSPIVAGMKVAAKNRDLHEAYLAVTNPKRSQKDLLQDRLESVSSK